MKYVLMMLLAFCVCCSAQAQGLPGSELPSPRGGTSAGGPLLPGESDDERWAFLQAHQRSFLGKSKQEIASIIGKPGGVGLQSNQLVYQVTAGNPKISGKLARIELTLDFDEHEKCFKYAVVAVDWL